MHLNSILWIDQKLSYVEEWSVRCMQVPNCAISRTSTHSVAKEIRLRSEWFLVASVLIKQSACDEGTIRLVTDRYWNGHPWELTRLRISELAKVAESFVSELASQVCGGSRSSLMRKWLSALPVLFNLTARALFNLHAPRRLIFSLLFRLLRCDAKLMACTPGAPFPLFLSCPTFGLNRMWIDFD